jgi:hypothetical protein
LYNMCFVFFSLPILYAITTKGHKIIWSPIINNISCIFSYSDFITTIKEQ